MTDYEAAAAALPPNIFAGLHRQSAYFSECEPAVLIDFEPGDLTRYQLALVRNVDRDEVVVSVHNMGVCAVVSFAQGSYCHPSYLEGKLFGRTWLSGGKPSGSDGVTATAVAAVVNQACRVVHELEEAYGADR